MVETPLARALDRAYADLDELLATRHAEGSNPDLERRIAAAWNRLDTLQDAALSQLDQDPTEPRAIPPDEMTRIVHRARAELDDDW